MRKTKQGQKGTSPKQADTAATALANLPLASPSVLTARLARLREEHAKIVESCQRLLTARHRLWVRSQDLAGAMDLKADEIAGTIQRLDQTRQHYSDLFHSAPVGYLVLETSGRLREVNQVAAQMLGRSSAGAANRFLTGCILPEDLPLYLGHLRRCRQGEKRVQTELRLKRPVASALPLPVELISVPFKSRSHNLIQFRTAVIDISHRREIETALERVRENYYALIDSVDGLLWEGRARTVAGPWRFTFVSKQAEGFLGYLPERWLRDADFWEHRLHPVDRARVVQARAHALARGVSHVLEYRLISAAHLPIWVRDSVVLKQEAGQTKLEGTMINITELKEMEEALRKSNRELETQVQQRTADLAQTCSSLQTEIAQRKRLETELLELTEQTRHQQTVDAHGDVGQSLAGIAFMIKSLGLKLEKTAPREATQAERIQSAVDQTMAITRDPVVDLVTRGMREESLPLALEALAACVESLLEVPCSFKPNGALPPISDNVTSQFYCIAVEAVVDAVKFGQAGRVVIALGRKHEQLIMTVEHDGHLFPTPLHHSLELGLKIMHYRARLIGASLQTEHKGRLGLATVCAFPAAPRPGPRSHLEKPSLAAN